MLECLVAEQKHIGYVINKDKKCPVLTPHQWAEITDLLEALAPIKGASSRLSSCMRISAFWPLWALRGSRCATSLRRLRPSLPPSPPPILPPSQPKKKS